MCGVPICERSSFNASDIESKKYVAILFKMVSTHFYCEKTLTAQLLFSLCNADSKLAHAVASELAASDAELLFRVLCLAWWLQPPDHPLQYPRAEAFLAQDCHALFTTLVQSPCVLPSLVTAPHVPQTMFEIKKALKKRQSEKIFSAALAMSQEELRTIGIAQPFLDAIATTIFKPLEDRILCHAVYALTAFRAAPPPVEPFKIMPQGSLQGRAFAIEDAALAAWQVRKPSAETLRCDPKQIRQTPMFETEEDEIAFYELHFPDDIPDEWSDAEIAKSHALAKLSAVIERNVWRTAFLDLFD